MPILSKPSSAARTSLVYITVGTLTVVWTVVWFIYLQRNPPDRESTFYWCFGFMISGFALLIIGLAVGQIGRSARHAELPPPEVTPAEANAEQTAAARAPMVAPANPAMPAFTNPGKAVTPTVQAPAVPPVAAVAPPTTPMRRA
jgi:hypothetical protein